MTLDESVGSDTGRRSTDRECDDNTRGPEDASPSTWRVRAVSAMLFVGVFVLAMALVAIILLC